MTDEQRCDSMGCYGSPWAMTPNLDAIANRGVRFDQALTPAPVCGPARAALLTGQHVPRTGVWHNKSGACGLPLLTEHFAKAGYATASFGKHHYCNTHQAFAIEENHLMSDHVKPLGFTDPTREKACDVFHHPIGQSPWILAGRFPEDESQTAEHMAVDAAVNWLTSHLSEHAPDPFFLRLSFNAPHTPVCPPSPFDTCIAADAIGLPACSDAMPDSAPAWIRNMLKHYAGTHTYTDTQRRRIRQCYYGQMAYADAQFGRLLDWMHDRDLLTNTIIAFVSDHGTHLADYGLVQKQSFYRVSVNVPFFITDMRIVDGDVHRVCEPVSTLSLMPTLMQMVDLPIPDTVGASSLVSAMKQGKHDPNLPVFSALTMGSSDLSHDRLVLVQCGDWKLALNLDVEPYDGWLCNVHDDPLELTNRYDDPGCVDVVKQLTQSIEDFV